MEVDTADKLVKNEGCAEADPGHERTALADMTVDSMGMSPTDQTDLASQSR